jgi:hypothetical protein
MALICTDQRYLEFCVVFTRQENTLEDLDNDADEQQQLNGIVFCFYSR